MSKQADSPTLFGSTAPLAAEQGRRQASPSACWSQTGVYGDKSCPELPQVVHCRSCPIYSSAGSQLLDRGLPAMYRQELAEQVAQHRRYPEPATASAIIFRVGNEWLALPTRMFQEVSEPRPIHSLPHRRWGIVLGLANVRGELLICVSLTRVLGLEDSPLSSWYRRLLVANSHGNRLAFPINEVQGPHRLHERELNGPPGPVIQERPAFVEGVFQWRERTVGLLNPESLFSTIHRNLA